jgi:homoserine kinase type II
MAVYTPVERSALTGFLTDYDIGTALAFEGILDGIENSNFFLDTTRGRFVLTLFEALSARELPWFLELMAFLNAQGIPCARPVADRDGTYLHQMHGKPAAIVERLRGASVETPTPETCGAVGRALARLHLAGRVFPDQRDDARGLQWHAAIASKLHDHLADGDRALLDDELDHWRRNERAQLPGGVVHGDLFRDNVLFEGNRVSGLIDFYYACHGPFVYDLAVTANDWCSDAQGGVNGAAMHGLLQGYGEIRRFHTDEVQAWPGMLRRAAMRFWLSRLYDARFPRPGQLARTKDPHEFRRILLHRRVSGESLREALRPFSN